jgi:hypothetical protein
MSDNQHTACDQEAQLELAAELTAAAYPVALRHGVGGKWLDLELDLWRVLAETVQRWQRQTAQAVDPPAILGNEDRGPPHQRRLSPRHA